MEIAFETRRRSQNRKFVLEREFSLICAKHETEKRVVIPILLQFDIIQTGGSGVIKPVNLL